MVYSNGKFEIFDPNSDSEPVEGDLYVDTSVNDISVKSVLQIIRDEANSKTADEWASIAGLNANDIEDLAKEFTSHGKKSVADLHRGVSQHTNGFYNVLLWMTVNVLIGNHDWQGGLSAHTEYDRMGVRRANLSKSTTGIRMSPKDGESTVFDTVLNTEKQPFLTVTPPKEPGILFVRTSTRKSSRVWGICIHTRPRLFFCIWPLPIMHYLPGIP